MTKFAEIAPRLYQAHIEMKLQMADDEHAQRKHVAEYTRISKEIEEYTRQLHKAQWDRRPAVEMAAGLKLWGLKIKRSNMLRKGPEYRDLFA